MSTHNEHDPRHRPELLAGYADGEIGPADRAAVENWIASDPQARVELEIQRRLSRKNAGLWHKAAIPVPAEPAWNEALSNIKAGLQPATPAVNYVTPARPALSRWTVTFAAVAALIVALIGPNFLTNPHGVGTAVTGPDAEVFAVAHDDDIDIVSLQGDEALVVVGRPPIDGVLTFVAVGDTELWSIESGDSTNPSKPTAVPNDLKHPRMVDKAVPVP